MSEANKEDYLYVITEVRGEEDADFLGLQGPDGNLFVPATKDKAEAETLLSRMPKPADATAQRQVEAVHRAQILTEAQAQGFAVYMVNADGAILGRIGGREN